MAFTNIHTSQWETRGDWRLLDLSGKHIGVRIEDLDPGDSSSIHHYHTLEEEHVIVLDGTGVLVLGDEEHDLVAGDHCWFAAGDERAHHIENRSDASLKFLVFGERKKGDVVVYPKQGVAMVKALEGWKQFNVTERDRPIHEEVENG